MRFKIILEEDVIHEDARPVFCKILQKEKTLLGPQFLDGVTLGGNRLSKGELARISPANRAPVIEITDDLVFIRDQGNPFVLNENLSRTDQPTEVRPGIHTFKVGVITFVMRVEEIQ